MTLRALNRTLLERQLLDRRVSWSVRDTVHHLVAVQGQEPNWPYVGLWTRIEGFTPDALEALVNDRTVVRGSVIRRTVHLLLGADYRWLRPTVQPFVAGALRAAYYAREIDGIDHGTLAAVGAEVLSGSTLTRREFGKRMLERFPGRNGTRLAEAVESLVPLVHAPETAAWGRWRSVPPIPVTRADEWLGAPMVEPRPDLMVLRYLAAFGPASVMDVQAWSGLTRLREVVDQLRPQLRVLAGDDGRELFDLPDAAVADEDTEVPVRFLPAYDNALLGYRDRSRIIAEDDRRRIAGEGSAGVPVFLVDGFTRGTWSVDRSTIVAEPFRPLSPGEHIAVAEEAEALRRFVGADDVVITSVER